MKKMLLLSIASVIAFSTQSLAQTPVSATWSLKTNGAVNITGAGAADITSAVQGLGAGITTVTHGVQYDTDNTPTNNDWQKSDVKSAESSLAASKTASFYTEYKITPVTGKYFQLNTVNISVVGAGGSTNRLVALYSLDGFTTSSTLANSKAAYKTEGDPLTPTLYEASEADPVALLNVGNSSTADLEGREVLTFSNLQINVNPLQTLSVRFYYYQTGTGNRFVANKNVVLSGRTDGSLIPLPLDFLSFKASSKNSLKNEIKLDWTTTNEVNTQKFIVESSTKTNFEPIGEVKSYNISGMHNYSFTDWNAANGVVYYRLKQIDNDGAFKYSSIVFADNLGKLSIASYPNPVTNQINVTHPVSRNGVIHIFGINGVKLDSQKVREGSTFTSLNVAYLTPGVFSMVFQDGDVKSTIKFIKE